MAEDTGDAELARRYVESRELRFFDELVVRYRERVMRLALSVLGPELADDAEDVVQEIFLRVHDRLHTFGGRSRFGSWLYRIAHNRALDHRRMAARRQRLVRRSAEAMPAAGEDRGAGERLLAAERDRAVRAALARLPQPYQTALRSRYWLELPVAEIAELLGVAPGTVKSYLHRGRARLARLLEEEIAG